MKTLVLEPDPVRARALVAIYGSTTDIVHVARSAAQTRLMLMSGCYDRVCLRFGSLNGARFSLLSVARAMNPDCEIVDLTSRKRRNISGHRPELLEPVIGPMPQALVSSG
ncbi:MAG: hypothetical protein AAF376_14935 [Pseudomonadota bacterium]